MKITYILLTALILLAPSLALAEDWYAAEERSACDYRGSMDRVVRDESGSVKQVSSQEVQASGVSRLKVEEDRAVTFASARVKIDSRSAATNCGNGGGAITTMPSGLFGSPGATNFIEVKK